MTRILVNTDLAAGANSITVWEPCVAAVDNVVVYTGNWSAAFSVDSGSTFNSMNPNVICGAWGETLCCDQVVIYIPQIERFAWLLQTNAGNYVLAIATPEAVAQSGERAWASYHIQSTLFDPATGMDFPEVAVGPNFLYITFNLVGKNSVVMRIPLRELADLAPLGFEYFRAAGNYWVRPVQNVDGIASFVCLNSASEIRVFRWPENTNWIWQFDLPIQTIPTENFLVKGPEGDDWLGPTSKVDWHIYGATQTGPELWVAWNGARRVSGRDADTFVYPHIGLAIIGVEGPVGRLIDQRYVWNPDYGFAWPALATNGNGEVGLSFCWGGSRDYPQHGVAMLTGPAVSFVATTAGRSTGAGGHYISVRPYYPDPRLSCASGFNQPRPEGDGDSTTHPHYVLFGS
jgi:hypothetical protein